MDQDIDSRQVLWANIRSVMHRRWGQENLTRLAREAGIGPGTCSRIKEMRTIVGLEVVDKIAKLFGLDTWQLLVPGLDPQNPPVLAPMSEPERVFYMRMVEAAKSLKNSTP